MTGGAGGPIERAPRTLWRRVGPDIVAMAPPDDTVHRLSGGASAAWWALETPATIEGVVERLASAHGLPAGQIADEVETCVRTLVRLGVAAPVPDDDG